MEKNNSKSGLVVGILIGIIIMLVVGIGLFATNIISFSSKINEDKQETNNSNSNEVINYNSLKGLYTYADDTENDSSDLSPLINKLYLYDNGKFVYMLPVRTPYGYMGNYVIEDNKIILNYEYQISGGSSLIAKIGESKDLLFNNDSTISDENTKLTRVTVDEEDEFLKDYDYKHIIETYTIQK